MPYFLCVYIYKKQTIFCGFKMSRKGITLEDLILNLECCFSSKWNSKIEDKGQVFFLCIHSKNILWKKENGPGTLKKRTCWDFLYENLNYFCFAKYFVTCSCVPGITTCLTYQTLMLILNEGQHIHNLETSTKIWLSPHHILYVHNSGQ